MTDALVASARRLAAAARGDDAAALAAVIAMAADVRDLDVELRLDGRAVVPDPAVRSVEVPRAVLHESGHVVAGLVREQLIDPRRRRRSGVHHTPHDAAATIAALALDGACGAPVVGDPSVGGGAFLLAAAAALDGPPHRVVERLVGCDIDPLAVAVTESALALWSGGCRPPPGALRVADFLGPVPFGAVRPDVIVGNPPFLGQLRRSTTRDGARREALRSRWPDVGGYVDDAAAFLLAAAELAAPGGTVALVQPVSFLAAADARSIRGRLDSTAPLVALWVPGERVFEAAVDTCAVVCRVGPATGEIRRFVGTAGDEQPPAPRPGSDSWAPLLSELGGTPVVEVQGPPLSTIASVTAGFRDQFYGLRDAVVDDIDGRHPLVTSGLIDPLELQWGSRRCRFDGRAWAAPTVMIDRVDPSIRAWVRSRLRPKLVVASQTRVIEAAVDPDGRLVPCTPVVVVEPHDPDDLWHLAAVLTSPVASGEIAARMAGSALSPGALRVSATSLRAVTLPPRGTGWDAAANIARAAAAGDRGLVDVGRAALRAFSIDDDRGAGRLVEWWADRIPRHVGTTESD